MIQFVESLFKPIADTLIGNWLHQNQIWKFYLVEKENPTLLDNKNLYLDIDNTCQGLVDIVFTPQGNCNIRVFNGNVCWNYQIFSITLNKPLEKYDMKLIDEHQRDLRLQKQPI